MKEMVDSLKAKIDNANLADFAFFILAMCIGLPLGLFGILALFALVLDFISEVILK